MRLRFLMAAAAPGVCALLSFVAPTQASAATITACVANMNGAVRFVGAPSSCIPGLESSVQFNTSGAMGNTGATGAAGPAGAAGPPGAAGPAGAAGPPGAAGPAGAAGPPGAAGPAGAAGPTGAVGPAGAAGPSGAAGAAGLDGATGATGATGALSTTQQSQLTSLVTFQSSFGNSTGNAAAGNGEPCTLGSILLTASNVAVGTPANGQTLSIAENTALFALLGTTYGGNGQTTFQLPNLRSITPNNMTYSICTEGIFPSRL